MTLKPNFWVAYTSSSKLMHKLNTLKKVKVWALYEIFDLRCPRIGIFEKVDLKSGILSRKLNFCPTFSSPNFL